MGKIINERVERSGYVIVSNTLKKCVTTYTELGRTIGTYFGLKEYKANGRDYPFLFKEYHDAIDFYLNIDKFTFYYDSRKYKKEDFTILKIKEHVVYTFESEICF